MIVLELDFQYSGSNSGHDVMGIRQYLIISLFPVNLPGEDIVWPYQAALFPILSL